MTGAQALHSEVVGVLKTNALLIFGITDIPGDKFFDSDARDQSLHLLALREKNAFLYAKEGTVAGTRIARYLCSDCIARVSFPIQPDLNNKLLFLRHFGLFYLVLEPLMVKTRESGHSRGLESLGLPYSQMVLYVRGLLQPLLGCASHDQRYPSG